MTPSCEELTCRYFGKFDLTFRTYWLRRDYLSMTIHSIPGSMKYRQPDTPILSKYFPKTIVNDVIRLSPSRALCDTRILVITCVIVSCYQQNRCCLVRLAEYWYTNFQPSVRTVQELTVRWSLNANTLEKLLQHTWHTSIWENGNGTCRGEYTVACKIWGSHGGGHEECRLLG
jgi:hypothetical protein